MKYKMNLKLLGIRADTKDPFMNYRLREARKNKNYTLKDVAENINLSTTGYNAIEKLRMFPRKILTEKISSILEKDEEYLFPKSLKELTYEIKKIREEEKNQKNSLPYISISKNLINTLPDYSYPLKELMEIEDEKRTYSLINQKLADLKPREREILELRYGLNDYKKSNLEEIGTRYSISRERVRQIEIKTLKKLYIKLKNSF